MSVVQRALFTWFTLLVFLILVVLRIDNRTQWNWFVVFIPLWIFNAILLMYTSFEFKIVYNNGNSTRYHIPKDLYVLIIVILKLCFEVMICLKLESHMNITLLHIVCPLWVILPVLSMHLFLNLLNRHCC